MCQQGKVIGWFTTWGGQVIATVTLVEGSMITLRFSTGEVERMHRSCLPLSACVLHDGNTSVTL